MIIVLKPHTSEENIHRVENLVKSTDLTLMRFKEPE